MCSSDLNIRIGIKNGAEVITNPTPNEIGEYYNILSDIYRHKIKRPLFPKEFFEKLVESPLGKFFLIRYNGKISGGSVCLELKNRLLYEFFVCGADRKLRNISPLYFDMKKTLPVLTSILIGISNFVINFWWLTLILLALAIFFARQYVRTEAGSRLLDNLKLNMPPFKGMFRRLYMARFTRMGQTLLITSVRREIGRASCRERV